MEDTATKLFESNFDIVSGTARDHVPSAALGKYERIVCPMRTSTTSTTRDIRRMTRVIVVGTATYKPIMMYKPCYFGDDVLKRSVLDVFRIFV